jgi:selenocysteine-specific elongation factor
LKQIILGTAGHIDHGKTSLIKAVTGVDTDRLKEEKLRGITIELGFASIDLPSGQRIGIVDVPGHEKFVKNMVAGATGIDIVAMIIAADEGIMPQTREHMEICSLLNIKHGFVVLTKIDLVDEEWLELVLDEVSEFTRGTFLEDASVLPVSAVTGEGIPEFIEALDQLSATIPKRLSTGIFRLPVDRVFSMKGFGTVITGTLISGQVRVGDTIMVYPSRVTSKVRGIQVHNQSVNEAFAGMRTAINFQGLEKASVNRGDVVAMPGSLKASYMVDVTMSYLNSNEKPIKNRTRIRFHTGTSEVQGNLLLLDRDELLPGETTVAQLRLDSPVTTVKDDRFVARSYSPVRTIGGGQVLNPIPPKHKRFKTGIIDGLQTLTQNETDKIISFFVDEAGYKGVFFTDLKIMTNLPEKKLDTALQALLSQKIVIQTDKENRIYIHSNTFEKLKTEAIGHLENYHRRNPLKGGMPKEELKSKLPSVPGSKLFNQMIVRMIKDKEIVQEEDTVRLAGHKVSLGVDQTDVKKKIIEIYQQKGLMPPYFKELEKTVGIEPARAKEVLLLLVDEGLIVKVKEDLYFHSETIHALKNRLVKFIMAQGEITTPQFKEMTGASRKYVIPLIEYFDSKNVTIRVGDIRKLRKSA